jgi:hypothetical protein
VAAVFGAVFYRLPGNIETFDRVKLRHKGLPPFLVRIAPYTTIRYLDQPAVNHAAHFLGLKTLPAVLVLTGRPGLSF